MLRGVLSYGTQKMVPYKANKKTKNSHKNHDRYILHPRLRKIKFVFMRKGCLCIFRQMCALYKHVCVFRQIRALNKHVCVYSDRCVH